MRFLTQIGVTALLSTHVLGHPKSTSTSRRTLHRRVIDLGAFRLNTIPSYSNASITDASGLTSLAKRDDYIGTATALVQKVVPGAEFRLVDDHYVGVNGIAHANFKQTIHGLDIDNADFNVNIAADGSVFSYGNSFFIGVTPAENPLIKAVHIDAVTALKKVSSTLVLPISADAATAVPASDIEHYVLKGSSGAHSDPKAHLVYFQTADNTLSLSWRVETDIVDNWLQTYIDAKSGSNILGVIDYVSDALYTVFPWEVNDPSKGSRSIETNPQEGGPSPFTWESDGTTSYTATEGNNGFAQANWEGDSSYLSDYRPSSTGGNFAFGLDLTNPNPKTYANASVTQLWYTANLYHDLLYDLGFTEAAGNFETNNNGKGGKGNDAVILNAQDAAGTDNADFATPADGSQPRMRMFIWDYSTPHRDCAFDAGVIIHEYTHGLSNRLTGGPANVACLNVLEAGGMGEGWGDFMAIAIHVKTSDTRSKAYPLGDWIYNNPAGIRNYLYSTSLSTNPLTYASTNSLNEVHAIGTLWATILYEVLWNLVDIHGITATRKPVFSGKIPTDGRFLAMKLVVDGMALQPCNPTMPQARDAIIDADTALTGGVNKCALWTAFAKRGLGANAKRNSGTNRKEDYTIPAGVC